MSFDETENTLAKVLVFTGAGVSVPLGLPSTMDFSESVLLGAGSVTQQAVKYLGTYGNDIERLLSILETFKSESSFSEFLLPYTVAGLSNVNPLSHIQGRFRQLKSEAVGELTRIKKIIFESLNEYETDQALALYVNLVSEIRACSAESSISIITTNYDLTFEDAFEAEGSQSKWEAIGVKDVNYCFPIKYGRPIYNSSQDFGWNPDVVEYLKIHGSLDWHRDARGKCTRSGSNTVPDDPDQMAILYPGFKGVPDVEPFVSIHGRLHRRLAEADRIIVIGFAFRDEYINSIFENIFRIRPKMQLLYFNPLSIDKFPDDSFVPHFIENYSCFHHIQRGIKVEERPLDLASYIKDGS